MQHRPDLFYAFVDLKTGSEQLPNVFVIPSKTLYDWFQGVIKKYFGGDSSKLKRWRFHPRVESITQYEDNWDMLQSCLDRINQSSER